MQIACTPVPQVSAYENCLHTSPLSIGRSTCLSLEYKWKLCSFYLSMNAAFYSVLEQFVSFYRTSVQLGEVHHWLQFLQCCVCCTQMYSQQDLYCDTIVDRGVLAHNRQASQPRRFRIANNFPEQGLSLVVALILREHNCYHMIWMVSILYLGRMQYVCTIYSIVHQYISLLLVL